MKNYTARIEFGTPGFSDIVKEKVLVALTITGYEIEHIVYPFEYKNFQDKCHKIVGYHSTLGIHRVINHANPETLTNTVKQAVKDGKAVFFERTDHDGMEDYFFRVTVTAETKRQMARRTGTQEIPTIWWRFGLAVHNLDKLIIQDGDYWYHMFGHFYFNTGNRE